MESIIEWEHPGIQMSNEEAKLMEISKLQKTVESLSLELDAAKLASVNECNKNAVLKNQSELSIKEKSALEREIMFMTELRNENAFLKVSLHCTFYPLYCMYIC